MTKKEQRIRDFYGITIGFIEEFPDGRKIARDFYRRKLGEYNPNANVTRDFYGRIVARGDFTASLIHNANALKNDNGRQP